MVYGHIYRNGICEPCDGRSTRHMNNVRATSVIAPSCLEKGGDGDGWERPKGGGGVDHRAKVQQRKAQKEISLFPMCPSIILCTSTCSPYTSSFYCKASFPSFDGDSSLYYTPGVLTTLRSNPDGSIIQEGGGISYPLSIID